MSDGTETLDQFAPEAPASEEVETNSLPADDASSDLEQDYEGDDAQTDEDEASEEEELDLNGKKYRINKELKPLLMMQQDYTRKTQSLAEERKALEADKEAIQQARAAAKEINEDRKKLVLIDDYLEKQSRVDWNRLWQEDPLDTPRKWAEYQHWQGQRAQLNSKISEAEQNAALEEERKTATRIQEALAEAKKIPGWNQEVAQKVERHALSYGLEIEQVNDLITRYGAPVIRAFHDSFLASQLRTKQQAAAKAPVIPQEQPKPLTQVSKGKAPARTGLHDDLPEEEWARRRREQLRNRK